MMNTNTRIDWQTCTQLPDTLLRCFELVLLGVQRLVLAALAREQDQAGLVGFESGNIGGETLGRQVLAA